MITSVRACERCGSVVAIVSSDGSVDNTGEHEEWHATADAKISGLQERIAALENPPPTGIRYC